MNPAAMTLVETKTNVFNPIRFQPIGNRLIISPLTVALRDLIRTRG